MATLRERLRAHRRQKRMRLLRLIVTLAVVCTGAVKGWEYIHQPGFVFGSINISGSQQLTQADIIRLSGSPEPFNLFNASLSRVQEALSHDIRFQNAVVRYSFPATVNVSVEERVPALYVANSYRSYLQVDYDGLVMKVTTGIPDSQAPLVTGLKCGNVYLGDKISSSGVMHILLFLHKLDGDARNRISEIAVDDKQQVTLRMRSSLPVLLGTVSELPDKAHLFMTVFNEIKNKNIKAEYINLKFAKPYIKLKQ